MAVFALIQVSPRCIMVHAESGVARLQDLHDLTLDVSAWGAFSHFLKHAVPLSNVHEALIVQQNPRMDMAALAFGHDALEPLVADAYPRQHGIGVMTLDR